MNKKLYITKGLGILLIAGTLLLFIPYTILVARFEYPDILREPTGSILKKFNEGGVLLIFTWLAFSAVGFPLIIACIKLGQLMEAEYPPLRWGTVLGITGLLVQMIALLRWVFVVPVLATDFITGNDTVKISATTGFKVIHQFGGVLLGECLGQVFTICWTIILCLAFLKMKLFSKWVHFFGIAASIIYFFAQAELLSTVIPGVPVLEFAGLLGSTLWLIYLSMLGILFYRISI